MLLQVYPSKPIDEIDYWSTEDPTGPSIKSETDELSENHGIKYIYPTSVRYKQQLHLAVAAEENANKPVGQALPRTSIGSVASGPISVGVGGTGARCVTNSPMDSAMLVGSGGCSDPIAATPSPNTVRLAPSVTRPLSEVPLSNRKLRSYNVKIKASNQVLANNAAIAGAATAAAAGGGVTPAVNGVAPQKQFLTELPSLMPPARLILSQQAKQKLADICGESDSEDERVIIPRALKGYPELGKVQVELM